MIKLKDIETIIDKDSFGFEIMSENSCHVYNFIDSDDYYEDPNTEYFREKEVVGIEVVRGFLRIHIK